MAGNIEKKTCFVVSPIGSAGSSERIHADWLLEGIINPVFSAHYDNFRVIRADKMPAPGMIDSQIIEHLLDAELVIADITTLNPNVFYEIGIRHVVQKPIVHMNLAGEPIPFDIKIFKHIEYSTRTPQGLEEAKIHLKAALDSVFEEGFRVDNPVTRTRSKVEFVEQATEAEKVIQSQLDELYRRISGMERDKTVRDWGGTKGTVSAIRGKKGYDYSDKDMIVRVHSVKGKSALSIYEAVQSKVMPTFGNAVLESVSSDDDELVFKVPFELASRKAMDRFEIDMADLGYVVEFS